MKRHSLIAIICFSLVGSFLVFIMIIFLNDLKKAGTGLLKRNHIVIVYFMNNACDTLSYYSSSDDLRLYSPGKEGPVVLQTMEDSVLAFYVTHYKIIK